MSKKSRRPQATRVKPRASFKPILDTVTSHIKSIDFSKLGAFYKHNPKALWTIGGVCVLTLILFNLPSAPEAPTSETRRLEINLDQLSQAPINPIQTPEAQTQSDTADPLAEPSAVETISNAEPLPVENPWQIYPVEEGDNLSKLFYRAGLTDRDVYLFTNQGGDIDLFTDLDIGNEIHFILDEKRIVEAKLVYDRLNYVSASIDDLGEDYIVEVVELEPDVRYESASAVITDSLFMAATRVGISERLTMELANIFGWDIDFALDIREQDQFKVIYEKLYLDGEYIGEGDIVAASFDNRSRHLEAVRYTDTSGNTEYHAPDGRSMRKAFLRTPVDFARISSHFNLQRRHPVLHTIRAHKGTDYAASRGTPIRAAGDGRVTYAGVKGGWGNVIMIQHGETYKTLYAHQSRFASGIRVGSRVRQGQVIGYVGSSGLATGPHLHYEFYVNGSVRNPVTVDLPEAEPIADSEREHFQLQTAGLLALLRGGQQLQEAAVGQ